MGHRRHQDIPVVLEADEAAIEEMVGIGREEQAILSIEALLVARVPPRLAVACAQMLFARDARDAACALDPHHVRLERRFSPTSILYSVGILLGEKEPTSIDMSTYSTYRSNMSSLA